MNKKISLGIAIGVMALIAAATFIITYNYSMKVFNETVKNVSEKEEVYTRLSELDKYVRANYVGDIDEQALMDSIMEGYVEGLGDRYAVYYDAEEYAELLRKDAGIKVGLGITWEKEESGYIKITSVTEGSGADTAGLVAGDIITAVNNTDVIAYENGYDEAASLLSCEEGTKVKLHIKRVNDEGLSEFFSVELTSEKTEIISVTGRLIDNVGYVKITTFNEKTANQLKSTLTSLIEDGAESLIFDLRGNLGGLIDSLGESLDCILGDCDVVTAQFIDHEEVVVKTTEAEKISMPMAVLVNSTTASCSELFAFALRDEANAQVVGTTTYGKGVMQYTHKLTGGAAVRVTVATLQTEQSGDYNGVGLKPQFEVSLPSDVDLSLLSDEEQLTQDTQLIKAIEVVQTIQ
ncbi:MAG: S41 family peptidase [Oscillospiraceae bacterium]|nr:S41 family peptidase [Oscillospiraceae bacterium]